MNKNYENKILEIQKFISQRKELGIKQETIARAINCTKQAVSKVENGKTSPNSEVSKKYIDYMNREIKESGKEQINAENSCDEFINLYCMFSGVTNENMPDPYICVGDESVNRAFNKFVFDFGNRNELIYDGVDDEGFFVIVDKRNNEIIGVRSFGRSECYSLPFFLFTPFIYISERGLIENINSASVRESVDNILKMLENEIKIAHKKAEKSNKKPLWILSDYGPNAFVGLGLCEGNNEIIVLKNYKIGKKDYTITNIGGDKEYNINDFEILFPSEKLREALDFHISEDEIRIKDKNEAWYPREHIFPVKMDIPASYYNLYLEAVRIINLSFDSNLGQDVNFYYLEKKVRRFECVVLNFGASSIINTIMKQLINSLKCIKEFERTELIDEFFDYINKERRRIADESGRSFDEVSMFLE